jgi:hypothetical protein
MPDYSLASPVTNAEVKEQLATVPGALPAIKKLVWGIVLMALAALGSAMGEFVPQISALIISFLPMFLQGLVGAKLQTALAGLATALVVWAKSQTKGAIIEAKTQEPTSEVRDLYVRQKLQ